MRRPDSSVPNRDIRESALTSKTLAKLSHGGERFFWRLTLVADDFGRFEAEEMVLLARCYPAMLDRVKVKDVRGWLGELVAAALVKLYRVGEKTFGFFMTWAKHQRQRAKESKYPSPASADICRQPLTYTPVVTEDTVVPEDTETTVDTDLRSQPPRAEEAADRWQTAAWPSPEALAHLYNSEGPDNLPAVETLSLKRKEAARRLLRQFPARDWWLEVFAEYKASKFLRGQTPPRDGHASFRADFDWLLQTGKKGTENAVRVHDGVYR